MAELVKSPHSQVRGEIVIRPNKRIAAVICGLATTVSLFSGCMFKEDSSSKEDTLPTQTIGNEFEQESTAPTTGDFQLKEIDLNEEVMLPWDAVIPSINKETGKFGFIQPDTIKTIGELEQIEILDMYYHGENEDLSWLRYCENLTDLSIFFYGEYSETKVQIRNITNIPNLKKLTLKAPDELLFNNYRFLLDLEIDELEILFSDSKTCKVDEELLNELKKKSFVKITGESYELITSEKDEITIDNNDLGKIDWNFEIKISPNTISNYGNIATNNKLYAKDLINLEELYIYYDGKEDLSWLKYCINLKSLTISYKEGYNLSNNTLKDIAKLPNLESLYLTGVTDFKKQDYECLNDINNLTNLTINFSNEIMVNADFSGIENLTNIKNLTLYYNSANIYIDFVKMKNLEQLTFANNPYTVVIEFDSEMYEKLIQEGCNINFKNEADLSKFIVANKQLDEIVSTFKLRKNASDKDKLDAILCWILENFRYSPEIATINRTIGISPEEAHEMTQQIATKFYEDGLLTAYFEGDGTEICGNYAAFFEALAHRINFRSNYVESVDHAYNLVVVDGEYYHVDATWLDPTELTNAYYDAGNADVIRAGNGKDLEWYLCNPEDVLSYDNSGSHTAENIPSDFDFNNVKTNTEEEKVFDITGKLVEIVVKGKKYIIPATIFIAILITFGLARKAKKERRRRYELEEDDYDAYDYDDDVIDTRHGRRR